MQSPALIRPSPGPFGEIVSPSRMSPPTASARSPACGYRPAGTRKKLAFTATESPCCAARWLTVAATRPPSAADRSATTFRTPGACARSISTTCVTSGVGRNRTIVRVVMPAEIETGCSARGAAVSCAQAESRRRPRTGRIRRLVGTGPPAGRGGGRPSRPGRDERETGLGGRVPLAVVVRQEREKVGPEGERRRDVDRVQRPELLWREARGPFEDVLVHGEEGDAVQNEARAVREAAPWREARNGAAHFRYGESRRDGGGMHRDPDAQRIAFRLAHDELHERGRVEIDELGLQRSSR